MLPYVVAVAAVSLGVGTLLTLCDRAFHVAPGALRYTDPTWTGQAWWVWPNFVAASAAMYVGAAWLFAARVPLPGAGRTAAAIAAFVAAYALSGLFEASARVLLLGFVSVWLVRLAFEPARTAVALFGVILALAGCAVEGALTLTGEFSYRAPEFFHVPLWLAGLYLHGSFAMLYVARRIETAYGRIGAG